MKWPKFTTREIGASAIVLFVAAMLLGSLFGNGDLWASVSAVSNFGAMCLTGLAVVVALSGFQSSEQTNRKEYQAYIQASEPALRVEDGWLMCNLGLRNYGRTPAFAVETWVEFQLVQQASPGICVKALVYVEKLHPSTDAMPIGRVKLVQKDLLKPFTQGSQIILGEIKYNITFRDVFDETHNENSSWHLLHAGSEPDEILLEPIKVTSAVFCDAF